MRLLISNTGSVPIYEQIKNQIIEQILNDELKEDEALPSIRELAADIKISVMTIKKAYDQLAEEGYIVTVHGKGTFVAPKNPQLAKERAQKEIEASISDACRAARRNGIAAEELKELIDLFYEEEN